MRGLSVPNTSAFELDDILRPIVPLLDRCWWLLGGSSINAGAPESVIQTIDTDVLDVEGDRVGRPGFFGKLGAWWGGSWEIFYASDSEALPPAPVRAAAHDAFDGHWFDPPPDHIPAEIMLIVRVVDFGRWDLFFRDAKSGDAVRSHLVAHGVENDEFPA